MNSKNDESERPVDQGDHCLLKLVQTKMLYGKYDGPILGTFPNHISSDFPKKDFPGRGLDDMFRAVYEIKTNGLEYFFAPLKGL
jgi:uncharacterized protein (DUF3820 family)